LNLIGIGSIAEIGPDKSAEFYVGFSMAATVSGKTRT